MVETAAHLVDHVFPPVPVPKRPRYFLQRWRQGQWPLYFGKPTLVIESSQHGIGIALIGIPEF